MEPASPELGWTYDDLRRLPDDGNRYETVDGVLLVTPSPAIVHQSVVTRLVVELDRALWRPRIARVFAAPTDVVLSPVRTIIPDLVVVRMERSEIIDRLAIKGVPDLVVEILSPSSVKHDRKTKLDLYGKVGVPEYWIVDPIARTIEVLVPQAGRMTMLGKYGIGDRLCSATFGFTLSVDAIFEQ